MISKTGSDGFTLIEVLLAVAILSIGITGVFRAFIVSLDAMNKSQEYIMAISLAKEKMADTYQSELKEDGVRQGSASDNFYPPHEDFAWKSQVTPSDLKGLNMANITVFKSGIQSPKEFSLLSYVREPKKSGF